MEMKTMRQWEESNVDSFGKFAKVGDWVDEEIVDNFLNCLPPACHKRNLIQCGEPYSHVHDQNKDRYLPTFLTFEMITGKWFYRGHCFCSETTDRTAMDLSTQADGRNE